jgi:hypothetical protein
MSSVEKPLVYLFLGASDSGRREIIAGLIDDLGPDARPAVMVAETESAEDFDATLPNVTRWTAVDDIITASLPTEGTHVFFVSDGRKNPVDQVEAFKTWLGAQGSELARAFTVVNCQFAAQHPPLLAWFEACVHFSDVVLLNRREGVENKWMSDFLAHFKKQFYPCLFEMVKDGRVRNPALVLEPEARRLSHVFDEEQDWVFTDAKGEEVDEQEEVDDEDEISAAPEEDPYFTRDAAGRRQKKIPDIAKHIGKPSA